MPTRQDPPFQNNAAPIVARGRAERERRHKFLALGLLCSLTLLLGTLRGASLPFWFDEIATAHIASAPTWHDMLLRSRQVDLHPPLEPVLVRLSFGLFGAHEFAGHLPSVLAFTLAIGSLFLFLRRRMPLAYAAFGALLPLCDADLAGYATEARSYGLVFGATCVAVLAYDTLLQRRYENASRVILALCLVAILQAHLFGIFAAGAFMIAEAVRTFRLRRFDALTWVAILLPWISCITYIPLLRIQAAGPGSPMVFEEKDRTSLLKGLLFYHRFLYVPLLPLAKVTAVVLLCVRFFPARTFARFCGLTAELGTVLLLLLATPVWVTLLLHVRAPASGFFPRYGIAATCPALLLLTALVAWRAGPHRRAGWLLTAAALVGVAINFSDAPAGLHKVVRYGLLSPPPGVQSAGGVEGLCPGLPLVINDALQFLEADNRLAPNALSRMVYLTDPAQSLRLEHENATQAVAGLARAFGTPHHVLPAQPFLEAHGRFLLLARPEHKAWLSDLLIEQKARMVPLGRYTFAGRPSDVSLISQGGDTAPALSGCATPSTP